MKLLVSTTDTQGDKKNDFNFLPNGEYVTMGFVCDRDQGDPDGGCGCGRSFDGVDHHRASTTAKVVESDLDQRAWREVVRLSLTHAGWHTMENFDDFYMAVADEITTLANALPIGTIVGRRLDVLVTRT